MQTSSAVRLARPAFMHGSVAYRRAATFSTWQSQTVGNVVKLNRFRKKKQREAKAKQAETNRIRHGRTQAEKDLELAERARAARLLEGKRLERSADEKAAPTPRGDESNEA
jgi:hypothetical protein